ncbi:MAG TPA: hypothetical protein VHU91_05840 [Mycobacteriales bacterium]|nr:hypothetical protein [Mycobacteriales bacterium]
MTSEQQSRDAALMALPSRDWLVTGVREEQGSRRRAAWSKTLRSDAEPATVEGVTRGYLDTAR